MENVIRKYLHELKLSRKQSYKNLALFPLLSTYRSNIGHLLLDEAIRQGLLDVSEKDHGGAVCLPRNPDTPKRWRSGFYDLVG